MTQEYLKSILDYDPETGVFRWRVSKAFRVNIGDVAGCVTQEGYRYIQIDGKQYRASRLAWLYVYGAISAEIDHKNRRKDDNRIANLREATRSQQTANQKTMRDGLKGVCWDKKAGKWRARVMKDGTRFDLGYFDSELAGHEAWWSAAQDRHGDFARVA